MEDIAGCSCVFVGENRSAEALREMYTRKGGSLAKLAIARFIRRKTGKMAMSMALTRSTMKWIEAQEMQNVEFFPEIFPCQAVARDIRKLLVADDSLRVPAFGLASRAAFARRLPGIIALFGLKVRPGAPPRAT